METFSGLTHTRKRNRRKRVEHMRRYGALHKVLST